MKQSYSAGFGSTAIIALVALVLLGGGLYVATQGPSEPVNSPEIAELPVNNTVPQETGTMMKDDPRLEELSDEELASDGATVQDLPEIGDEVVVSHETSDPLPLAAGTYEEYSPEKLALAETGDVVIFFHAKWCPSCRGLESDIKANLSQIPAGTHILVVDYDTATDLKKKYGVVRQHTLVQVDASGNEIKKLTGLTNTLKQVVSQL